MALLQQVLPGVDLPILPPKRFLPDTPMVCATCGVKYPFSEGLWLKVEQDEDFYCTGDCAIRDGWVSCESCGEWLAEDDAREYNDDHYCNDCWDESFFTCEKCDCDDSRDTMVTTPEDEGWCTDCFNLHYDRCDECDEYILCEDACNDECGNTYCQSCYDDNFSNCVNCGDMFLNDDLHCANASGEYYCQSCYDELEDDDPGENYYTANPTYNNVGHRRFGVEFEYNECTHHANRPYFKDIPEYTGREYISSIMYSDGGLQVVRDFATYADGQGWTIDDNGPTKCGYHLHIDCTDFCLDQIKSVAAAYIQSRSVWYALVEPWRETEHSYSKFEHYNLNMIRDCATKSAFRQAVGNDRYKFINWNAYAEHGTVEIRGHEATRDVDEICNWITAHTRFVDHVSQMSIDDICKLFKGAVWRDFKPWKRIVGVDIADFYRDKAERHGNRLTIVTNRHAQLVGSSQ